MPGTAGQVSSRTKRWNSLPNWRVCRSESGMSQFHGIPEVPSMRIHGHPHGHGKSRFVLADVHLVPDVLPEHARVENAPAEVSPVTKVEKLGAISAMSIC